MFATCSPGKKILGGGCYQGTELNLAMVNSFPNLDNQWGCRTRDVSVSTTRTLTAYAICGYVQ